MRKHYLVLFFSIITLVGSAQDFQPYPNQDVLGWDTSPFESYTYSNINFRLMFPNNYDSLRPEKYPIILFFHGAGERGLDNEKQLVHGGRRHRDAVLDDEFQGLLLYPQNNSRRGNWGNDWIFRAKDVLDKLILDYNVDPNRIYVHGLSGGGEATWTFAMFYPEYVTAMHPMSGAASTFLDSIYKHVPIWLSQGGLDRAPTPDMGNFMVYRIRNDYGGDIRYTYYPDRGHNTWNAQYAQPDFFTWFLEKHKTDIMVFDGRSEFCEGDPINLTLGVTAGFTGYEWAKDDTTAAPIATGVNEINVTQPGKYYVRFENQGIMTKWSKPADINRDQAPSPTPTISANGESVNLPTLEGRNSVDLIGPENQFAYQWLRDGANISGATASNYTASNEGTYALTTRIPGGTGIEPDGVTPTEYRADPVGCFSNPSNPIVVTTENGLNVPARPANFFVNLASEGSVILNWDDVSGDELAFEIYRSTSSGASYQLLAIVPSSDAPNPQSYLDTGLDPNTTYYYQMRAVNNSGGSPYTDEVSITTAVDTTPPSAPVLSVATTSQSSISLLWSPSLDNFGVEEYDIYRNGSLIATVSATQFTNTGLPVQQLFSYVVRAKDAAGNVSLPSNQVTAATVRSGLRYDYYHHQNLSSTTQIETNGTLIESGNTNNFDISLRQVEDRFAFVWEGYINIPESGNYTFFTDSDDGSTLFINGNLVVNNDGRHGCRERSGSVNLPAGFAEIKVFMFENGGGQCLNVEWQGPGISKEAIPDEVLNETIFVFPDPPNTPTNLLANPVSFNQVDLSWTDNSIDELNFEIFRSLSPSSGFQLVHLAAADAQSWTDTGLIGNTTYYYRIRAINGNGESDYEGPASVTTLANPPTPAAPTNLNLALNPSNQVDITWDDNASNETGYEIYRTTNFQGSGAGSQDYSVSFDGSNDYIAINNLFYNGTNIPELTVEAWIKTSFDGNQVIASFDRNEYFRLEIAGDAAPPGRVGFGIETNAGLLDLAGNTDVSDGQWHHVAAVYNNGVATIYVDGEVDASTTLGTGFGSGNTRYGYLGLGSESSSYNSSKGPMNYFNGEMEEVRIWSVARSQQQLNEFRSQVVPSGEPGLEMYFRFKEGSGTNITDFSGNNVAGVLFAGAAWTLIDPALVIEGDFTLIHTTAADVTSYTDTNVFGNNMYYYKLRAIGVNSFSSFTSVDSIQTDNNNPVITPIIDRSVQFNTTLLLDVEASDPDNDPINFTIINPDPLPPFASFAQNGSGQGELTLSPGDGQGGNYPFEIIADDGSGGSDTVTFAITVSDNSNPVITAIDDVIMEEGFTRVINISATDIETPGDIVLNVQNLPPFASFVDGGNGNGTITINSFIGAAGGYNNITVTASDGQNGFSEERFNLSLTEADRFFTLGINFTGGVSSPGWNDVFTGVYTYSNLINFEGQNSNVNFEACTSCVGKRFQLAFSSDLPSGLYPENVKEPFFLRYKSADTLEVQMVFKDLNPALQYRLTFLSAINQSWENTHTRMIDVGGDPFDQTRIEIQVQQEPAQILAARGNSENTLSFGNIIPDANNEIVINIDDFGDAYFVLNSLVFEATFDDGNPPDAPSNISLEATSTSTVDIAWQDNSSNETGFEIYRSDVSSTGPFTLIGTRGVDQTTFSDEGLTSFTQYFYKVRAFNNSGFTESLVASVTTSNAAPVVDPIADVLMISGQQVVVPISASDPEGQTIILSSPDLPSFAELIDNGDGTGEIIISPLPADAGDFGDITVTATDIFDDSGSTTFALDIIDGLYNMVVYINFGVASSASQPWANVNSAPSSGLVISNLPDGLGNTTPIDITVGSGWTNGGDDGLNSGQNAYLYEDLVTRSYWRIADNGSASLTINDLDPTKAYTFEVYGAINQWFYNKADYTVDGATRNLNANFNEDNILVFSNVTPDSNGDVSITVAGETVTQDSYLNAIIIREHNPGVIIAPSDFHVESNERTSIDLSWVDNSFNESGFEIYRSDAPGRPFTLHHTTGPDVTVFKDSGLTTNTAYIYRVRAVGAAGSSPFTEEMSASTLSHMVMINIKPSGFSQASAPWNNTDTIPGNDLLFQNLIDDQFNIAQEELAINVWETGQFNTTGMQPGGTGVYPDEVLQAYYWLAFDNPLGELEILNADPLLSYDLEFGSSDNGTWTRINFQEPGISEFIVDGQSKLLNFDHNTNDIVRFRSVEPSADGSIPFSMKAHESSVFVFFNALVLKAYKEPEVIFDKTPPSVPVDLAFENLAETSVSLSWSISSDNVGLQGYEVYEGGNLLGFTDREFYDATELSPGYTYNFTVRAVDNNNNRSAFSAPLEITTPNSGSATEYFYIIGDISQLTSWNDQADGTGNTPVSFTADNQLFRVGNNAVLNSPLSISGVSSKVVVESGITLDLNAPLTAVVEGQGNCTININTSDAPDFDVLDPLSTVAFNSATTNDVPVANYGNITFAASGSTKNLGIGNIVATGTVSIDDNVQLTGATPNDSEITVRGNLILQGNLPASSDDQMVSFNFSSGNPQDLVIPNGSNLQVHSIRVADGTVLSFNPTTTGTLTLGSLSGGGLTVENNAQFVLGDKSLIINGNGSINSEGETGRIATTGGSITINSDAQSNSSLSFASAANTLRELVINLTAIGDVTVQTNLNITEELVVNDGIVHSNQVITLVSDATRTALIPEILNDGEIRGNVESQRYIPGDGRMWRYVSTPIEGKTVADWQQHIPVHGNFTGSDNTVSWASLYYYDEPAGGWVAYPTTSNQAPIEVGRGYSIYMHNGTNPVNLSVTGPVFQGEHTYNLSAGPLTDSTGWNLIGNVYPAPIQWGNSGWTRDGVASGVWIRDNVLGDFWTWDADTGVGDDPFTGEIAVGQSFWVQVTSETPQLAIAEAAKVNQDADFFRTETSRDFGYVQVSLSGMGEMDYAHILVDDTYSDEYDPNSDIVKRKNDKGNLFTQSADGIHLAINKLSEDFCEKIIPLKISDVVKGNYTFNVDLNTDLEVDAEYYLADNITGSIVDLSIVNTYDFSVTELSQLNNRFDLIIRKPELMTAVSLATNQNLTCMTADDLVQIELGQTQRGVVYRPVINGNVIEDLEIIGSGNPMVVSVSGNYLQGGNNIVEVNAEMPGCRNALLEQTLAITGIEAPHVSVEVSDFVICSGENLKLAASSDQNNVIYRWTTGDNQLFQEGASGVLNIQNITEPLQLELQVINEYGCKSSETVSFNIAVDYMEELYLFEEDKYLISSISDGDEYRWYLDGAIVQGADQYRYENDIPGNYKVEVVSGACNDISDPYIVLSTEDALLTEYRIYPNPTRGLVMIAGQYSNETEIDVYHLTGQRLNIPTSKINESLFEIDLSELDPGMYIIRIKEKDVLREFKVLKR